MLWTYVSILRRRAAIIVVVTLALVAPVYLALSAQGGTWSHTTRLNVSSASVGEQVLGQGSAYQDPEQRLSTELEILNSDLLTQRASGLLARAGWPMPREELRQHVTATRRGASSLIEIKAESEDPAQSRAMTEAWSSAYVQAKRDDQAAQLRELENRLEDELVVAEQDLRRSPEQGATLAGLEPAPTTRYEALVALLERVRLRMALDATGVQVLTPASQPVRAQAVLPPAAAAVVAGLAASLVGAGVALLVDLVKDPVRSRQEADRVPGLDVLGELRVSRRRSGAPSVDLAVTDSPEAGSAAELRTRLDAISGGSFPRLVEVTSIPGDEGDADVVAAQLAAACARSGMKVLLASNQPTVASGVGQRAGDDGLIPLADGVRARPTALPGLHVVSARSNDDDGPGLLDAVSPVALLRSAIRLFDVVVLTRDADDPSPRALLSASGTSEALLVVCRIGRTRASALIAVAGRLGHSPNVLAGLVLVRAVRSAGAPASPRAAGSSTRRIHRRGAASSDSALVQY
ncbi:MAG: protein tyrosine kinase [Frankiales bacterium]|nr:protein tyrosine kinase [Frankiales bacterium]